MLDRAYEQAALEDQDGDGMQTWEEFVAGTIPTDRDSRFIATIDSVGIRPCDWLGAGLAP